MKIEDNGMIDLILGDTIEQMKLKTETPSTSESVAGMVMLFVIYLMALLLVNGIVELVLKSFGNNTKE